MDTSKKVIQLREAAQEKREEIRRKREESKERLGGIIPEVKPRKKVNKENSMVINRLLEDTNRRQKFKMGKRNSAMKKANSTQTNLRKFLNAQQKLSTIRINDIPDTDINKLANDKVLEMLEESLHQF